MKNKKSDLRIKSSDHDFDLWFFGQLLDEAVRLDNAKGVCNLIDDNPELSNEYFKRKEEKMKKQICHRNLIQKNGRRKCFPKFTEK